MIKASLLALKKYTLESYDSRLFWYLRMNKTLAQAFATMDANPLLC